MSKKTRLETIKDLLELAKRSDNIHEAQSAMEKAQRIALKEGVDLNSINMEEEEKRNVISWIIPQKTKTVPSWRGMLATVIADNFRVKAIKVIGGGISAIKIVGLESDIEVFKVMFDYAETCIEVFFKRYLAEKKKDRGLSRHDSLVMRNSYVMGFIEGISKGLRKNVEVYALALCLPEEVTRELDTMNLRKGRAVSLSRDMSDIETYGRGYQDGESAGSRDKLEG